MAEQLLGARFDIHGGGLDLKFPHHENEIAQSCAASGEEFAHLWMHNGFLNIDDEKMSKSLGNFFTIREALKAVRAPEVIRYFVLSSHYRGPLNYSLDQLDHADAALNRIYTALRDVPSQPATPEQRTEHTARFIGAMDDDFNTPEALAILQTLTREINSARAASPAAAQAGAADAARIARLADELRALAGVLGLTQLDPAEWFRRSKHAASSIGDAEIEQRIQARLAARKAKNWAESDRIRNELATAGVILEDKPGGITTWRRS